jgi:hypothetical protein
MALRRTQKSSRRPRNASRPRRTDADRVYVTHGQFEAVLAIIEQNTVRIERLEDVFALQTRERPQVKQEIEAMKRLLKTRRRARRR